MNIRHLLLLPLIMLSACSAPTLVPQPVSVLAPKPMVVAPAPAARPAGDWLDWPLAAGDWSYLRNDRGSVASFGLKGQSAALMLRCDTARRQIQLARQGTGTAGRMIVRTSSATKDFMVSPNEAAPSFRAAEIVATDPILDAMAFSRGRIAVETDGQSPIAIPSWAEITRVIEDCRG